MRSGQRFASADTSGISYAPIGPHRLRYRSPSAVGTRVIVDQWRSRMVTGAPVGRIPCCSSQSCTGERMNRSPPIGATLAQLGAASHTRFQPVRGVGRDRSATRGTTMKRTRALALVGAGACLGAVGLGVAQATIPDSAGVIHGCALKNGRKVGLLRVI